VNAAQKKKAFMALLVVGAIGAVGFQLAPAFGLTGGSSKKKTATASKLAPGEKPSRIAGGKKLRVAGGQPARVAGGKPSRVAGGKAPRTAPRKAPRRVAGGNQGPEAGDPEAEKGSAAAARRAGPQELAELLDDSDFDYRVEGLRDPMVDLLLIAQMKREQEAAEKPYRPEAKVEGILWSETRPLVIIEGKIYEKGQSFDGKGAIVEIHPSHIVVGHGLDTFGLSVSGVYGAPVSELPPELHARSSSAPDRDPLLYPLADELQAETCSDGASVP